MVDQFTVEELKRPSPARFTLDDDVSQRFYTAGKGNQVKETGGLKTCVRIAVIGSYLNGNTSGWDRFLAHVDDLEQHRLEAFIHMINEAKRQGLVNLRAVVIAPFLHAKHAEVDDEILQDLQTKLESVIDEDDEDDEDEDNIDVQRHPDNEAWFLTINEDKTFTYGKDGSSSSSGEDEDSDDSEDDEDIED